MFNVVMNEEFSLSQLYQFFQAIMMLDDDICEKILCSESFELGNVKELSIVHLAGRYGLSLQVCILATAKLYLVYV